MIGSSTAPRNFAPACVASTSIASIVRTRKEDPAGITIAARPPVLVAGFGAGGTTGAENVRDLIVSTGVVIDSPDESWNSICRVLPPRNVPVAVFPLRKIRVSAWSVSAVEANKRRKIPSVTGFISVWSPFFGHRQFCGNLQVDQSLQLIFHVQKSGRRNRVERLLESPVVFYF